MGFKEFTRKVKCRTPLQFNIGLFFVVYAVIVVGLLWVMETILLPNFYYVFKIRETQRVALSLLDDYKSQDAETFTQTLDYTAASNQMCISIYDSKNRGKYFRDTMNNNCLIHGYDNQHNLYKFVEALDASPDGSICMTVYDDHIGMQTLVVGYMIGTKDDIGGCIFINTILEPVGATVRIQMTMILMFSIVLLVIGIIIAFVLSNRLSVPITRITESAKRMAHGDYQTKFEGGSCREVDELARALTYAEHEISKTDMMQRDLIANVSHDLRTPLTMLKAYAEMIRDLSGDNPVKREAHLKIIIDETDRLAALVNDILDLSKLENGSQKLEVQEVSVKTWMEDIITRYKGVSEQMGYHISFTPDEDCVVICDPSKMERVVCNLINNAINYTGEDKQVFVTQINTESCVRIEVRDTGDGIEEDKIQKIFDKYYRSENHKREVVGTGLGLSIVKAILRMHGCNFGVRSKLGEGSIFWFEIKKKMPSNKQKAQHQD